MMNEALRLPPPLREFVDSETWTYAKTMPEWPHEYLVRDRVDTKLFESLVRHIREQGIDGRFYNTILTYFAEDGLHYWTMGDPIEETIIINRCREEESYENRLKNGTLPDDKQSENARKSDDELIKDFTRIRRLQDKISIQVKLITWSGPHSPKSHWHTELILPSDTKDESICIEQENLLSNPKYFAVCKECQERNPIGWMHDDQICQSCAGKHGVVY